MPDSRRLGRVALPVPSSAPGAEPKAFTVEVPPMSHLLGVTQEGGNVYLHFWFWDSMTRIVKQPRGVKFLPCEKLTLLWWFAGERYSGLLGVFLHTVPMNGITSHLFDMTDYNHETGRVEG